MSHCSAYTPPYRKSISLPPAMARKSISLRMNIRAGFLRASSSEMPMRLISPHARCGSRSISTIQRMK
jgi:hypothetical protein